MGKGLVVLAFAAAFAACSPSAPPAAGPEGGKAVFKALNCRACHRVGADGTVSGPDLTLVGFRKSADWLDVWLKSPQGWRPGTMMPDPHLTDNSRKALVAYLVTLKGQDWGDARPWNEASLRADPVERGHVLFARAGCVTCHGIRGAGGYPDNNVVGGKIPALQNISERYTKEELKTKIRRGVIPQKADPKGPDPLLRMPPWGDVLKDDELDAVVEYLWTLKAAGKSGQEAGSGW